MYSRSVPIGMSPSDATLRASSPACNASNWATRRSMSTGRLSRGPSTVAWRIEPRVTSRSPAVRFTVRPLPLALPRRSCDALKSRASRSAERSSTSDVSLPPARRHATSSERGSTTRADPMNFAATRSTIPSRSEWRSGSAPLARNGSTAMRSGSSVSLADPSTYQVTPTPTTMAAVAASHRQRRATVARPVRRCSTSASSSSNSSRAERGRRSGDFCRQRITRAANRAGTPRRPSASDGGDARMCALRT